ncbi:MAG: hypothetical protein AAF627_05630 [Myxococcota bacterium]
MMKRLVILAGFLAACGETSSNGPGTGGTPDAGGVPDVCGSPADPLNNDVCRLVAGTPSSEVISPVGDVDRFSFDASEGEIISIVVENEVTRSPVTLRASLFAPDGMGVAGGRYTGGPADEQRFVIQYVARASGSYALDVSDVGNDDQDDDGTYFVTVTLLPQEDLFEPNDSPATAAPLTLDTTIQGGRIASQGDQDWFVFTLQNGAVLRIVPTGAGQAASIRFQWSLFQAEQPDQPLATGIETEGAWPEQRRAIGLEGGEYLLRVTPVEAGESDPTAAYSIALNVLQDPDLNEAAPNESTGTATALSLGDTVQGFVASNSDLDYYSFQVSGSSPGSPVVVEVALEALQESNQIQYQFDILRPNGQDLCTDQDRCLTRRRFTDGSFTQPSCHDNRSCRTAHPLTEDGTYYVLVHDWQDNDFDDGSEYRLSIRELDVDTIDGSENFSNNPNDGRVVPLLTSTTAPTLEFQEVSGFISYVGDEDYFILPLPSDDFNPPQNGDWEWNVEFNVEGPSQVEYSVFVDVPRARSDNLPTSTGGGCPNQPGTMQNPSPCNFPNPEAPNVDNSESLNLGALAPNPDCNVVFGDPGDSTVFAVRVRDAGSVGADDYDLSPAAEYRIRFRFVGGCRAGGPCDDGRGENATRCTVVP